MKIVLFIFFPLVLFATVVVDSSMEQLSALFIVMVIVNFILKKDRILLILINSIFLLLFITIVYRLSLLNNQEYNHINRYTYSTMTTLGDSLELFKLDNGNYPSTKEGLGALIINPNPKKYPNYPNYPYIKKVPVDGLNKPFIYIHYKTDKDDNFQLISFGADGKYGGEGDNEDIVYPNCQK